MLYLYAISIAIVTITLKFNQFGIGFVEAEIELW